MMELKEVQTASPSASTSTLSNRGSPSTLATSPTLSPPKSPDYRQASLSPSTIGESPLPPLPTEVYLLIIKFIPSGQLPNLLLVSKAWKNCLECEPKLWPNLSVSLDQDQESRNEFYCKRASVNSTRFGGGLKSIKVTSQHTATNNKSYDDIAPTEVVLHRFHHLIDLLYPTCVPTPYVNSSGHHISKPSSLISFSLYLCPNTIGTAYIIQHLFNRSMEAPFCGLKNLDIQARIPDIRISSNFFSVWPSLRSMTILSTPANVYVKPVLTVRLCLDTDPQTTPTKVPSVDDLESIFWSGLTISGSLDLPHLPVLKSLVLNTVIWEGKSFFLLIRIVRKTLVHLECNDFIFLEDDTDDGFKDFDNYINIKDPGLVDDHCFPEESSSTNSDFDEAPEPAPVILPVLERLILTNCNTPPFFASLEHYDTTGDSPPFPTPIFYMPNLNLARIEDISLDAEDYVTDSESCIAVLGRNAPNVTILSLSGSSTNAPSIFYCLAGMSAKIVNLDLNNSSASDSLLSRLPSITPLLEELDVRLCTEVTIQGVARLVENMRDDAEGKHKMIGVKVDPPEWGDAEYTAYLWLDYVGVLVRADWDYEGTGPTSYRERIRWIKQGKRDIIKVENEAILIAAEKERLLQIEAQNKIRREMAYVRALPPTQPQTIRIQSTTSHYFAPANNNTNQPTTNGQDSPGSGSDSTLTTPSDSGTELQLPSGTITAENVGILAAASLKQQQQIRLHQAQQQQQQQQQQFQAQRQSQPRVEQQTQQQQQEAVQYRQAQYDQYQQYQQYQLQLEQQPHHYQLPPGQPQQALQNITSSDPRLRRAEAPSPVAREVDLERGKNVQEEQEEEEEEEEEEEDSVDGTEDDFEWDEGSEEGEDEVEPHDQSRSMSDDK